MSLDFRLDVPFFLIQSLKKVELFSELCSDNPMSDAILKRSKILTRRYEHVLF